MNFENFKALITSYKFPGLMNLYMENSYIPSLEEYEEASERIFNKPEENDFFHSYEGQVFL